MFSSKAWPDPAHWRGRSPAQGCWVLCGGRSAAAEVHAGPARDETWLEAVGGEDSPCPVIETSPTGNTWWTGQRRIRQWKRERFGAAFHGVVLARAFCDGHFRNDGAKGADTPLTRCDRVCPQGLGSEAERRQPRSRMKGLERQFLVDASLINAKKKAIQPNRLIF